MSRRRFFASPDAFKSDRTTVTLESDEARHLRDVLRLRLGEEVFVFDGEGSEFRCVVEELKRDSAALRVEGEVEPARPESALRLTLAIALLKGEKLDLVVQKATELGATRIKPVWTTLADVKLKDEADGQRRVMRLRRIALEAAKQSGRARLPQIDAPVPLSSLLKGAPDETEEWSVMFSERGGCNLIETIESLKAQPRSLCALVGSEGGWTDEEISDARGLGWSVVTLGGRILRAETAAIAVTALMQHLFGDLK
jgi:16S rRNA (uracil1498-N3)-methyltransferase